MSESGILERMDAIVAGYHKAQIAILGRLQEMAKQDESGVLAKALQQAVQSGDPAASSPASASAAGLQSSAGNPPADSEPVWVTSTPELPECLDKTAMQRVFPADRQHEHGH